MATSDTNTGAKVKAFTVAGPASYAAGGFLLDVSSDFSWLGYVTVSVATRGVLPPVDYELLLNRDLASADAPGKATIKLVRGRYDKATIGNVSGLPGGVAVQAALFAAATTVGSSHSHSMNHDHPSFSTFDDIASGTLGVLLAVGGGNMRNHGHNVDVAALVANTTATTHAHNRAFEYEHIHGTTVATADLTPVEVAGATNLSGVSFLMLVTGFGKQ